MHYRMREALQYILPALFLLFSLSAGAQVTGGVAAFGFLRLPQSPHITALGGTNIANPDRDVSLALQNPALMRPGLHNELALNYNAYYAGIHVTNLAYGYHVPKLQTSFALGIQYLDYGSFRQTDQIGNIYGDVSGADYVISLGAARTYGERWRYGATLKWAQSRLADKSASALLADVGVLYVDTANLITVGITAKNMGFMVARYNTAEGAEPLPFDLQLGFTKRFAHLPFRLMVTAHHLYEWDVRYNNPADIDRSNLFGSADTVDTKSYFADKLFRHLIFGGEFLMGKRITLSLAYNHLRRGELALKEKAALAGFSFGAGINLNKFQIHYARSYYHLAGAYNEFGLNISLGRVTGLGKTGARWHWSDDYPDWKL